MDNDDKENEALDDRWMHGHGGRNDVGVMVWPVNTSGGVRQKNLGWSPSK